MLILRLAADRQRRGTITPGTLTGVEAAAACGLRGGGYVPLHVRAIVKGRDEAGEAEQSCSAGAAEFPGIVDLDSYWNLEHQTGKWRR